MNDIQTTRSRLPVAFLASICAFLYAAAFSFLAMLMSGAGHGWGSAGISGIGLALLPLAAVAWVYRRSASGRLLLVVTLLGALVADAYLIIETRSEGFEYVGRVWSAMPLLLLLWFILWLAWQVALAVLVLHHGFRFNRNA